MYKRALFAKNFYAPKSKELPPELLNKPNGGRSIIGSINCNKPKDLLLFGKFGHQLFYVF